MTATAEPKTAKVSVTCDYGGYSPKTNRYAITCPRCHTRGHFDLTGGDWPTECPTCNAGWFWAGV